MTENNGSTITTELTSLSQPAITLPINATRFSNKSGLIYQPMGILYHDKQLSEPLLRQIKVCLNKTFTYTQIFHDRRKFTCYLADKLIMQKIIFIICSTLYEHLSALVKERSECYRVYILKLEHESFGQSNLDACQHVKNYLKEQFSQISHDIKAMGFLTDRYQSSFDGLDQETTEESSSLCVFNSRSCEKSFRYLSSESLKFLLFQSNTEVLINMDPGANALNEMLHICRGCYKNNTAALKNIDDFKKNYTPDRAIHYYTQDSFLYRQVNQAFRLEDVERIFKFRAYVTDLYQQIVNHAKAKPNSQSDFEIYRGTMLSNTILQQLRDHPNQLISMNGFLSTTRDIDVAKIFAGVGQTAEGYESVLFKLSIDKNTMMRSPFTDIKDSMNEDECEILFAMGSVWLLETMERTDDYWMIQLRSCDALDSQLTELKNLTNGYTFLSMGNILRELGEYSSAKNFYRRMLDGESLASETRGLVYYHMGLLADELNEYMDALENFLKAEELVPVTVLPNSSQPTNPRPLYASDHLPSRLRIWNNIARSYEKKGDFENARLYYQKAVGEKNDPSGTAIVKYNLGSFEYQQGNYEEACKYLSQAIRPKGDQ